MPSSPNRILAAILSPGGPNILGVIRSKSTTPRNEDTAVLWVFRDYAGRWCVRMEGGDIEATFVARERALAFARATGEDWGSYRLFFALKDGRIAEEVFNLGCR